PIIAFDGLFQEFWLPLDYIFTPQINIEDWLRMLSQGLFYVFIIYSVLLILINSIERIINQSKETIIIISLIIFSIFGYLTTENYFFNIDAYKGRQKFWDRTLFGKTTLFPKNYLSHFYLKTPKDLFELSADLQSHLIQNNIPYLTSLEISGFIINDTVSYSENNKNRFERPICIKSITGTNFLFYNDLISKTSNNKVIIGKDASEAIDNSSFISLNIKNIEGSDVVIDLGIDEIMEFPIKELNSAIFVNRELLNNLIKTTNNSLTKLQILKNTRWINNYTNESLIAQKSKDSYHNWQILTKMILFVDFITSCTKILVGIVFLLMILCIVSLRDKNIYRYLYTWGHSHYPFSKNYWILISSLLIGIIISKIKNIFYMIYETPLPNFLKLKDITPTELQFGFGWTGIIATIIFTTTIAGLGYFILKILITKVTKYFIIKEYQDHIS
ncbi:MAG: hypothetical protein ACRCTJ_04375, partial [Brevinema sp.]